MQSWLVGLIWLFFSLGGFATSGENPWRNMREGRSVYHKQFNSSSFKDFKLAVTSDKARVFFQQSLNLENPKSYCAYSIHQRLMLGLKSIEGRRFRLNDFPRLVYLLRQENEIDDVVAKILLKAHEVKTTQISAKDADEIYPIGESEKDLEMLKLVSGFKARLSQGRCFDEVYRQYVAELKKLDKGLESLQIEGLHWKAFEQGKISSDILVSLEQARLNEVDVSGLTLSGYLQKLKVLRAQYPLTNPSERSDFVTQKEKRRFPSHRQRLFENYSELQIIMMGNVIKKLRQRLEYDAVEIQGFRDGVLQEKIPLEPMERFRFAIKALRKEMSLLTLNSFFNGQSPSYMDLMVASYEIGVIPSSELDAIGSLEELWNPKKTFWDKAGIWVRTFASVATIVIPPPFGFIPALAIVVIEATAKKSKPSGSDDPTSMF